MPSVTFSTPGPVKLTCPPNVTSWQVEAWGNGAAGLSLSGNSSPGGGSGGYSCEPSLSVIPGVTYRGFIAHGGRPSSNPSSNGGQTTWGAGQVTAYGASGYAGGAASGNTIAYPGGNGGSAPTGAGGGGGAASAGPSGAGANGGNGGVYGGNGGAAVGKAGDGGQGGNPFSSGANGGGPGGGGGGAGYYASGLPGTPATGGYGAPGMIRITWQSESGSPQGFPLPIPPVFPAGYQPDSADLNAWLHDPFSAIESRPVARLRQAISPQSVPDSGSPVVIAYDTIDEDPLQGWDPSSFAWIPPPGWSGVYAVTVTLCTLVPPGGSVIRPGIIAPGSPGVVASMQQPGAGNDGGVQGSFWCYLVGGQDPVQATATLVNASSSVNTNIGAAGQSTLDVVWISLLGLDGGR
jgi:hypothetical protein